MSTYTSNNKMLYTWTRGVKPVPVQLLSSYAESLILDPDKRTIWHKGAQYGNSYYQSEWGESFNDFLHNTASGAYSHAEGTYAAALGAYSHVEGSHNTASLYAYASSVEGAYNYAAGKSAHAEGELTSSYGEGAHTEGYGTYAAPAASYSHSEGFENSTYNEYGHAEGLKNVVNGRGAHAEGYDTKANGEGSHSEGNTNIAKGSYSHAEGNHVLSDGANSHAEGDYTITYGEASHAEGFQSYSKGKSSHAEGFQSYSIADYSHSEGKNSYSEGKYSHSEGSYTVASGLAAHTEGTYTKATGDFAHASGYGAEAIGSYSAALGYFTQAKNMGEVAIGRWNKSVEGGLNERTIFTIGDGQNNQNRHNIVEVTQGATYIANKSYLGDYMFGDVAHSYVDYTGHDTNMDLLIQALLDEGRYTKPVVYSQLAYYITFPNNAGGELVLIDEPVASYEDEFTVYTYVEVGTIFRPAIYLKWPTIYEDSYLGTRMGTEEKYQHPDYFDPNNDLTPQDLGYSYGPNGDPQLYYNRCTDVNWATPKKTIDAEANVPAQYINNYYILPGSTIFAFPNVDDNKYGVMTEISVPYKQSSHMLYDQLYLKGKRQITYGDRNPWFGPDIALSPQSWYADARFRWFAGFSNTLPQSRDDVRPGHTSITVSSGFLKYDESNAKHTICRHHVTLSDARDMSYFWIAIPADYQLDPSHNGFMIQATRGDGVNFDLVTAVQPMDSYDIEHFNIGELANYGYETRLSTRYTVYYIKFKFGNLGNDNIDLIKWCVKSGDPYLNLEDGSRIANEMTDDDATPFVISTEDANTLIGHYHNGYSAFTIQERGDDSRRYSILRDVDVSANN